MVTSRSPCIFLPPTRDVPSSSSARWLEAGGAPSFCGERFEAASAAVMEPRMDFDALTPATVLKREGDDYTLSGEKCLVPLEATLALSRDRKSPNGMGKRLPQALLIDRETPVSPWATRSATWALRPCHHPSLVRRMQDSS